MDFLEFFLKISKHFYIFFVIRPNVRNLLHGIIQIFETMQKIKHFSHFHNILVFFAIFPTSWGRRPRTPYYAHIIALGPPNLLSCDGHGGGGSPGSPNSQYFALLLCHY